MEFVWSDELAALLIEEDAMDPSQFRSWLSRPIAYRLPEDASPLVFGRRLLELERAPAPFERRAS